jgi:hypothetical protein
MKRLQYAVIVWMFETDVGQDSSSGNGVVYGWYESLGWAMNTASDLIRNKTFGHAIAVKML